MLCIYEVIDDPFVTFLDKHDLQLLCLTKVCKFHYYSNVPFACGKDILDFVFESIGVLCLSPYIVVKTTEISVQKLLILVVCITEIL